MLVLTAWTGIAHASEAVGCAEAAPSEMVMHMDGDCDQVPADADKGYPHHHAGCHGHHVGTPTSDQATTRTIGPTRTYAASLVYAIAPHDSDQALRPPQA